MNELSVPLCQHRIMHRSLVRTTYWNGKLAGPAKRKCEIVARDRLSASCRHVTTPGRTSATDFCASDDIWASGGGQLVAGGGDHSPSSKAVGMPSQTKPFVSFVYDLRRNRARISIKFGKASALIRTRFATVQVPCFVPRRAGRAFRGYLPPSLLAFFHD